MFRHPSCKLFRRDRRTVKQLVLRIVCEQIESVSIIRPMPRIVEHDQIPISDIPQDPLRDLNPQIGRSWIMRELGKTLCVLEGR